MLISDDFQTFERQKNANSGKFKFGHCLISATLFINSADVIFMGNFIFNKTVIHNMKYFIKIKAKRYFDTLRQF
jgi:hypothetical protein